ncbi:hypothetical protein Cob_v005673 [Colletotrichum orbiculare MAFF 240422]|uniref:Uncharacterized protein n=1 Tax=Colletotrichum orbiculare (strain 104-T / ATCC 96160 / CBS 514.97 / LARS 414 / MAFF 240422) TaxID=1213857 RepID=A0A484FU78_COLOR|nr:hypothetical protein Cob_v005673 [Colletotrichum orbiculare MAFF 240422]
MSRGLKNGNPKIRLTTQTTSLVIKKPYRASLKQSDTFKTPNSFIMQFFSSATIFLAAMAGVAVAAPVDTPASKVDARSASEMLSARDIKLVREILSSSETFQNAVAKREVDEREIPVYIIFTYAE